MSPEGRRPLSKLLILRPHPWAYHPVGAADRASADFEPRRLPAAPLPGLDDDPPPPTGGWREYLAGRLTALERQIQRLGHTPRDWLF